MKRCPQCGRDYNDDSLSFCLDDGSELLFGPSMGEPATAIFSNAKSASASGTSRLSSDESSNRPSDGRLPKRTTIIFGALGIIFVTMLGVGSYVYFSRAITSQIDSIAVMPFVNDSNIPELDYLSDGMTETLISSLTQLPGLNVKARSSVFRYKGKETDTKTIGKELNVKAILNGVVAQRGDQMTLSLELVDVATENAIWSQQYVRKQSDLASLQNEIARDVLQKLRLKISGADEQNVAKNNTANSDAYQLYLKGRYHYNKFTDDGYRKGIEYFDQATQIDPDYALAYTGLADCYFGLSDQFEPPTDVMPKALAAAEKALALNDSLAEAHASLGLVRMFYELNWAEAEREFQRATALDPNYANGHMFYSRLLLSEGRFDEAVKECEIAAQLEPLSPVYSAYLGTLLVYANKPDEAVAQLKKALELNDSYAISHFYLGTVYQKMGKLDNAIAEYEKAFELNRNARYLMAVGNAYGAAGQRDKALHVLSDLEQMKKERYVSSYFLAVVHAGLNNKNEAFALIGKAFDEHADSLAGMKTSVLMDNLRSDPRFAELVKRTNLPE